jgi:type IV pilus assembly protein PilM
VTDGDRSSIWKKELSFRRTPKDKTAPVQQAVEPTEPVEPTMVEPVAPKAPPQPPAPPSVSPREATGLGGVRRTAPHISPFVREQPHEAPAPPPAPDLPRAAKDEAQQRPHLRPVESPPRELPVTPKPPAHDSDEATPPLSPAAAAPAAAAPVVVQSQAAASEDEPASVPEPAKIPFWKKERSVRGSKKAKPAAETVAAVAAVAALEADPKPKRKISFSRSKTPKPEAPETAAQSKAEAKADAPRVVKTPVWKRSVTVKRPDRRRTSVQSTKQEKRLVGLKIGASQIAAARVANNGSPELVQVARAELRSGIVVGGELRDVEALAVALKDFFEANKLPMRGVRLGIANNRIGVRTIDVQGVNDPRQLDNAVRFRAQEALPIPIDEAVLDYQVLSESRDADGHPVQRVLLVVAYRELVDRYVQAFRKAGIRLVGIDLEAFALLRALSGPRTDADAEAALVAVSVGHQRSTFAVSDGRMCQFTRVLDWGGATLDLAIARQLDVTAEEASRLKHRLSLLPGAAHPVGLPPEQSAAAMDAVRNSLQGFARELVSSLQFYQNQAESLGIGEIVMTGGTAHLPGIADELQRLTGVTVRVGDPLGRVKVGKRVEEGDQIGSLAVAIGLGIED